MTGKVELSTGTVNVVFNYLKRQSWIEVNDIIVTLLRELPQLPLSATFDDAQTENQVNPPIITPALPWANSISPTI